MNNNITSIIVTYNRQDELLCCLQKNLLQTFKMKNILIVNNASTDSTWEKLCAFLNVSIEKKIDEMFFLSEIDNVKIYIINKSKNTGGSGGFSCGMELAHRILESDYLWLMDDDGFPSENCLEQLIERIDEYDYVMPVSININKQDELSWSVRKKNGVKTVIYKELRDSWGDIMNFVTPFNGVLLSKKCVSSVGYINKDFFIWGDEYEHWWRCKENNINPVTIMDSIFFHPAAKLPLVPICFGLFKVPYVDSELRMCCLARNYTYIYLHHDRKVKIAIKYLMYFWLYMITRKLDINGWKLYTASVRDAYRNDFTRHLQFLRK